MKIPFFWLLMASIRQKILGDWVGWFGGTKTGNWSYPKKQRKLKSLVQKDEEIQISTQIFMTALNGCSEDTEYGMPVKCIFK